MRMYTAQGIVRCRHNVLATEPYTVPLSSVDMGIGVCGHSDWGGTSRRGGEQEGGEPVSIH